MSLRRGSDEMRPERLCPGYGAGMQRDAAQHKRIATLLGQDGTGRVVRLLREHKTT